MGELAGLISVGGGSCGDAVVFAQIASRPDAISDAQREAGSGTQRFVNVAEVVSTHLPRPGWAVSAEG